MKTTANPMGLGVTRERWSDSTDLTIYLWVDDSWEKLSLSLLVYLQAR